MSNVFGAMGSKHLYDLCNTYYDYAFLYDDDGSPCVLFMVVLCGMHVINVNLECYLQWYLHSYFGL